MVRWALVLITGWTGLWGAEDASPARYGRHRLLARSMAPEVTEASGVAPSHFDPDVFWTHNDSGAGRLYAFRLSDEDRRKGEAVSLGYIELLGFKPVDWEDLAAGPDHAFYAFDGGDNPPCKRTNKRIVRISEPQVDWSQGPIRRKARVESFHFEYPAPERNDRPARRNEDRYDAECLLVHPKTGDVYIVTKRDNQNKPAARVYFLPAASIRWNAQAVHIAQYLADLSPVVSGRTVASMITGGAVSSDGRRVVLRSYIQAFEFTRQQGRPFGDIFMQAPRVISLLGEPQGEGICYAANGDLITTSEGTRRGPNLSFFIVPAIQPADAASRPAP